MEIVTAPNMSTSAEAVTFVKELLDIIKALDVCDGSLSGMSIQHPVDMLFKQHGAIFLTW